MKKKRSIFLFILGLCALGVDLFSKYWVDVHLIPIDQAFPVYPFGGIEVFKNVLGIGFAINKVNNFGGAWSLFSSYPKTLLGVRIVIFCALLLYMLVFNKSQKKEIPFTLILAGALGNIFDALVRGSVIDLFHFILWGYSLPIFNVADVWIFSGSVLLAYQEFFKKDRSTPPQIKVGSCN